MGGMPESFKDDEVRCEKCDFAHLRRIYMSGTVEVPARCGRCGAALPGQRKGYEDILMRELAERRQNDK